MPQDKSALTPPHRLNVWLTPDGRRFFVCNICKFSFELPRGANYDRVARQFDAHPCIAQKNQLSPHNDPTTRVKGQ